MPEANTVRNLLLATLPRSDRARVAEACERKILDVGQRVGAIDSGPEPSVCFPEEAVLSMAIQGEHDKRWEVGLVGCEGLAGWSMLVSRVPAPVDGYVEIPGSVLSISAERLTALFKQMPKLELTILRFIESQTIQLSATLASGLRDPVVRRIARRLLMLHDRVPDDRFPVTHQQMGSALGMRRATVTDAIHLLEGDHLVRSRRGEIEITDRAGLARVAGEAYGATEESYSALICPFGKCQKAPG